MTLDLLTLAGGVLLLVAGGEALVRGAASLADRLGVPPLVIGLTVVAFGTSAPELVVSVTAAWRGSTGIAFGNVVGSNVANLGLILGACALLRPLAVHTSLVRREVPLLIGVSLAAVGLAWDGSFSRAEGLGLLAGFVLLGFATVRGALRERGRVRVELAEVSAAARPVPVLLGLIALGLAGLGLGAHWTVAGGVAVARAAGLSEAVIGATLVALATSLPELVTSVIATRRGAPDVAVGNVLGSNLFNLLLILGATATSVPVPVPPGGVVDAAAAAFLALLLLPLGISHGFRLVAWEGALLLACYAAYVAWKLV